MDNCYTKFREFLTEGFKDCVMAEVPELDDSTKEDPNPILSKIKSFIKDIPDDILYIEGDDHGKETWPHVTLLYGLKDDQFSEVKDLLKDMDGKITATLGKITKFKNEKFDVLKIEVKSEDFAEINRLLKTLPNENTYPTYVPHLTLAYLKSGEGEEYVNDNTFEGAVISIDRIVYSDENRKHQSVLAEMSGWGGGGAGYGGAIGGSISPAGWAGTFGGTSQNINKFATKRNKHTTHDIENSPVGGTEGSRSLPMNGNTVMGWSPYDSIKPEDLDVPGVDKDELFLGMRTEMERMLNSDKNKAKQIAVDNIAIDPKYYSGLKRYMAETVSYDQRVKAVGDIVRDLYLKRNGESSAVNNPANQMIQSAIESRKSSRTTEAISEIMRDMYKIEKDKPKKTLKDIQ